MPGAHRQPSAGGRRPQTPPRPAQGAGRGRRRASAGWAPPGPGATAPAGAPAAGSWKPAAGIFLLALALRLLFWQATPDAAWPYPAVYKGDAALWLDYAAALEAGRPFELGLPLRPPGNAWLIAALWDGTRGGVAALRALWCALGAAAVALLYAAARRGFGPRVAALTGLACAGSYGLLALSVSLNNETPYLVLVAAALRLWPALAERPRAPAFAGWAVLGALACLVRVEHALFFAAATGALAALWRRRGARPAALAGRLAGVAALAALVLAPWHASAWAAARRLNREPAPLPPGVERAIAGVEAAVAGLPWAPEAARRRDELPAFTRRTAAAFVAATAAVRGRERVTAADFGALEEAFGAAPEPLPERFFVALYGPLNFHLANHAGASGGFSRAPLERPPPLAGGAGRYPGPLIAGLPPPDLALTYPPHLEAVVHGYDLGWSWIAAEPAAFARLTARKLAIFWSGAALGVSGWNLPLGLDGVRRPVDLAVPAGPLATAWHLALLVLAAAGLLAARGRRLPLAPWLLFLASQLAVTLAFFGYARTGATVIPVLALLLGLLLDRLLSVSPAGFRREPTSHRTGRSAEEGRAGEPPPRGRLTPRSTERPGRPEGSRAGAVEGRALRSSPTPSAPRPPGGRLPGPARWRWRRPVSGPPERKLPGPARWWLAAALLLLAAETARYLAPPDLSLDGRPVTRTDPFPPGDHAARRLEAR